MEHISKRLRAARIKLGLNQKQMAQQVGIAQKDISILEAGKKKFIHTEHILFLSSKGVDLNWVYTGSGEMFLQDTLKKYKYDLPSGEAVGGPQNIPFYGRLPRELITIEKTGDSVISMVPIKASAGYVASCQNQDFVEELPTFSLPDFRVGSYRAFEIMGDSMELTIMSQDWVIGERVLSPTQLKDGVIYVIVTGGNIICKRIVNKLSTQDLLVLKSDNPQYEDQTLSPDEILEMWLIRARLTKDFRSISKAVRFYDEEIRRLEKITDGLMEGRLNRTA